ncbi:UNVERIFIED_CONTAM: hypothetical protein FKN15_006664 [Acipenser sinensis]
MTTAEDARKLRDWILENAGLEAQSMPVAIRILWMMDRERWEAYQREHTPNNLEEGLELVLGYLEAAITTTAAQPKWEEPERPQPKWEEPERPQPKGEEPERPTPEWEEPERPTPEWEEPERPTPEWEEPERPTPEWEEPERPTPEWEESVHPQPKEREVGASTAVGPKLPADGECLLVSPPPAEEGQDAGVPKQSLFMLLKAARRAPAQPPQQREPAPPQPPSEWPASAPSPLPPTPPPAEGEYLLVLSSPLWEDCWPLPPPPAEGEYLLVPPGAEEQELPLPPPLPGAEEQELQAVWWPEPQKGELPATKKGEEVWRPLSPAALSLQEFLWPEPHRRELPATKKGEVGGPPAPAAFPLQDWTSRLSAVPLPAGVLTALPAMGPLKPPFPAETLSWTAGFLREEVAVEAMCALHKGGYM